LYFQALSHIRNKSLLPRHVLPSARLPAYISAASTERISVKFDIGDFHENLSRNQIYLKSGKNIGHFT
jgi:hypothetical protein